VTPVGAAVLLADDNVAGLHLATAVWTWVMFLVTFFVLSKVAWPMLARKMEERELRIAEGLKKAEEAEARARDLMEQQESILAAARADAQKLLADSRAAADNMKNDILRQAQEDIGAERERAKREIELERAKAIDDLKQATIDLTLEASARLLRRELRAKRQPAERQRSHSNTDQQATQETVAERSSATAHKTCDGHHGMGQLAAASATPIRAGNRQIITRRRGLRNVRVQQTLVRRLPN